MVESWANMPSMSVRASSGVQSAIDGAFIDSRISRIDCT
jgi:hypothetical protein